MYMHEVTFPKGFIGERKMADKKITALTALGTGLAGEDLLPRY